MEKKKVLITRDVAGNETRWPLPMDLQMFATDGTNRVTFGLKNCHFAIATYDQVNETVTYGEPIKWPGSTEISLDINGELQEFEADDIVYYTSSNNKGYTGSLTSALVPDAFLTGVLGEEIDTDDQVQTEISSAKQQYFAMMFEFQGDAKAIRHVLYWCKADRPGISSATGKNVNTQQLSFNATPRPTDEYVKTKTKEKTTAAVYDNWYKKVYEKVATP